MTTTPGPTKDEYAARLQARRALREKIELYRDEEPLKPKGPLDSSLKKHTTLLNKLRSALLTTSASVLIKEGDALSLGKYTEEIAAAVLEGVSSSKGGKADADAAVEVIVHLHARLTPDFLPNLLPPLLSLLTTSTSTSRDEKEDKERISRLRPVLRVVAELGLIGAWEDIQKKGAKLEPGSAGAEEVLKALQSLMSNDPQFSNIPLVSTFLKHFQRAYLGPSPLSQSQEIASTEADEENELVPATYRERFRKTFEDYFKNAGKVLVKGHTRMLEQDRRNHEAYIKSGEIFEDRQQAYEKMTKAVEKLQVGVQSLADLLGLTPPTLPTAASLSKSSLQIVDGASMFTGRSGEDIDVTGGIWDDEEEKKFYEDIVDLADEVPAALLGIQSAGQFEAATPAESSPLTRTTSIMSDDAATADGDTDEGRLAEQPDPKADGEELDPIQSGPAARLNAIFAALPDASNRTLIDKLAVEFAFLNSKGARKRMYKFLGAVPKNRTDLLPHYSRFAATLNRYMPDIGAGLIAILDEEFKYLQRKKLVKELDSVRIKNVRYFGELAKFKVAQTHTIMHCLKVFLEDLTGPNIDMAAMLLESCGRFLLRSEATSERMKAMLDLMRRKQSAQHFDARQQLLLENAFYQCNPPVRQARQQVQLTPMEAFVQHLIHDVLAKKTVDKVIRLLRKLHWEDPEVYDYLFRVFTEIWEVKFGTISLLAMVVYDLQRYHPEFGVSVVDQVLEDVKAAMEANVFEYHQRRIATMKYLGELYMYRVISTPIVFETLWLLVSYGHADGLPVPGRSSPIDTPDDFFRVRLVCTLLDTCGACFDKGSNKKKLDHFLTVFQLYVLCKADLPTDVHFMISDTLEAIRPKMTPYKTFQEAAAAIDELMAQGGQTVGDEEDSGSEDGSQAGGGRGGDEEDVDEDDGEETAQVNDNLDDDDDEKVVLLESAKEIEYDQEAEEAFNKEFAKMLADTTETRRVDRKTAPPVFDTAVPLIRRAHTQEDDKASDGKHMQFALLSKKGNKQQIRTLEVPIDSSLAVNTRSHQLQNKQEQEQLKMLVLQNERRQEQSEKAALEQSLRNRGIRLKFAPG